MLHSKHATKFIIDAICSYWKTLFSTISPKLCFLPYPQTCQPKCSVLITYPGCSLIEAERIVTFATFMLISPFSSFSLNQRDAFSCFLIFSVCFQFMISFLTKMMDKKFKGSQGDRATENWIWDTFLYPYSSYIMLCMCVYIHTTILWSLQTLWSI